MKKRIKVGAIIVSLLVFYNTNMLYAEDNSSIAYDTIILNSSAENVDGIFAKNRVNNDDINCLSNFADIKIDNREENGIVYTDYCVTNKEPVEIKKYRSGEIEKVYETTTYSYAEDIDSEESSLDGSDITLKVSMKYSYYYINNVKAIKVHTVEGTILDFNKTGLRYSGLSSWVAGTRYANENSISSRGQETFDSPQMKVPEIGKTYSYETDFQYYYVENDSTIKADFFCEYNNGDNLYHVACTVMH